MNLPAILFGAVIASLLGVLFHLWKGGGPGRILFYLALAWLGFIGGHLLGLWQRWMLFPLGALDLGLGILGSVLALFLGDWLARVNAE